WRWPAQTRKKTSWPPGCSALSTRSWTPPASGSWTRPHAVRAVDARKRSELAAARGSSSAPARRGEKRPPGACDATSNRRSGHDETSADDRELSPDFTETLPTPHSSPSFVSVIPMDGPIGEGKERPVGGLVARLSRAGHLEFERNIPMQNQARRTLALLALT